MHCLSIQGKAPAERRNRAGGGARGGGGGGGRGGAGGGGARSIRAGLPPIVVNLNSSTSELKLLRVLQTLVTLSGKDAGEMIIRLVLSFSNADTDPGWSSFLVL